MARPLRISFPHAFYHLSARGNERRKIFLSKADYEKFKGYLKDVQEKYQFILHAYVLMSNHYHLIGETPLSNLSEVMQYLNGSYTTYFNKKRQRSGHLFQGRYKSILIDKDAYLLELSRYIHLNPVRARLVDTPEAYPYSSYRAYIDSGYKDAIACSDLILSMASSRTRYRRFVEEAVTTPMENPLDKTYGGIILGTPSFIKDVLRGLKDEPRTKDVSRHRRLNPLTLEDIDGVMSEALGVSPQNVRSGKYRNMAIYCAKSFTGLTNREIGQYFGGISYSAVTKAKDAFEKMLPHDGPARKALEKMKDALSRFKG